MDEALRPGGRMKYITMLALLGLLTGCVFFQGDRKVSILEGVYRPAAPTEPDAAPPWRTITGIEIVFIDRKHQKVWMLFDDASLIVHAYETVPKHQWLEGCPTNLSTTLMEVLALGEHELVVGTDTLPEPILVRNCPADPVTLVLRDRGNTSTGGNACIGAHICQVLDWTSDTLTLPMSMKGYELYSWRIDKEDLWMFTLVTGTNRVKTWEDISSPDSTMTDEAWVKITIRGKDALKSVIDRLPAGETLLWQGGNAPSSQEHYTTYPDEALIQEIASYSRQRKVNVRTSDW